MYWQKVFHWHFWLLVIIENTDNIKIYQNMKARLAFIDWHFLSFLICRPCPTSFRLCGLAFLLRITTKSQMNLGSCSIMSRSSRNKRMRQCLSLVASLLYSLSHLLQLKMKRMQAIYNNKKFSSLISHLLELKMRKMQAVFITKKLSSPISLLCQLWQIKMHAVFITKTSPISYFHQLISKNLILDGKLPLTIWTSPKEWEKWQRTTKTKIITGSIMWRSQTEFLPTIYQMTNQYVTLSWILTTTR